MKKIGIALIILLLAGCNKEANLSNGNAITVKASIGAISKVSYSTDGNSTSFTEGDGIAVYGWTGNADEVPAARVVDGVVNTLGADGKWTPQKQMLWKNVRDRHYFLGVFPARSITDFKADEYTLDPSDYTASDLLIAKELSGITHTKNPIGLEFNHAMAKFVVRLTFRSQWDSAPTVTSVKVISKKKGTVDYLAGKVTADGAAEALNMSAVDNATWSALQIPQDGVRTISIRIDGNDYVYTHGSDIPLVSGKYTTIGLIVGNDKIELDSGGVSVIDWESGAPVSGEATLQDNSEAESIEATGENVVWDLTKSAISDDAAAFTWSTGDRLAVHCSDGKYYPTVGLANGGSKTATFTVSHPAGTTRDAFAIFPSEIVAPAEINYGQGSQTLDVSLPDTYSLSQVSGTLSPCPMIAANTPGSGWNFKQLCGLFRLRVNAVPEQTSYLKIDFHQNVSGIFSIPAPIKGDGSSNIAVENAGGNNSTVITVTGFTGGGSYTLGIPLPVGTYSCIDITAYDSIDNALLSSTRRIRSEYAPDYTVSRAHGAKLTATLVSFSLSSTKKVIIAPGNLVARVDCANRKDLAGLGWVYPARKWYFADRQYDYNASKQLDGSNEICDHFSWIPGGVNNTDVRGSYGLIASTNEDIYYPASGDIQLANDWGNHIIYPSSVAECNYPADTWWTPDGKEWEYLAEMRSVFRYVKATVDGVPGVIFFPDNYSHPAGVTFPAGVDLEAGYFTDNDYPAEMWEAMEAAGCVFLPVAGNRVYNTIADYGIYGHYWMKTADGALASNVFVFDHTSLIISSIGHSNGCSVRLVRDIK